MDLKGCEDNNNDENYFYNQWLMSLIGETMFLKGYQMQSYVS